MPPLSKKYVFFGVQVLVYNIVTGKEPTTKTQQKITGFQNMEYRDIIWVSTGNRQQKTVYLIYTAVLTDVQADCPNRLKTV